MPKSKREKIVSLTKTKKKSSKEQKKQFIEEVQDCVDKFTNTFVISFRNMRNSSLKELRNQWKPSRFFFGKNKLIMVALGKDPQNEYKDHLYKLGREVTGNRGLFFTNSSQKEVLRFFQDYRQPHFARSGFKCTEEFALAEGELNHPNISGPMEPQLRQLGLPTKLIQGKVNLERDHVVCSVGEILTPEQCKILQLFEIMQANFEMSVHCMWSRGKFTSLDSSSS